MKSKKSNKTQINALIFDVKTSKIKKMYILEKLECKLFKSKLKYYLITGKSGLISVCLVIAIGLYIGLLANFGNHPKVKLILIPGSIGFLAILIGYGVYLRQLQLRINNRLKEIEYLQNQTPEDYLFYLLVNSYFIYSYLNYILYPKTTPDLINPDKKTVPEDMENINYFKQFQKPKETGHEFYKRNFEKYDRNLIRKHSQFLDLLVNCEENSKDFPIYLEIQICFIVMETSVYTDQTFVFNRMKKRFEKLDNIGLEVLRFSKFHNFELQITKITPDIFEQRCKNNE